MKKFTLILLGIFTTFAVGVSAQNNHQGHKHLKGEKCGTMEVYDTYIKENQAFIQQQLRNKPQPKAVENGNYRTNAIVTIPVVVHIVLPNPNRISNADVQSVLDKWNVDFSGLNADSANGAPFYNVRGHSNIRFCLAKRTPTGALTSGIERRASSTTFSTGAGDPIKRFANGGLDSWDNTQYMNIWVGVNNGGILGYATFPGTASALDDGLVINAESFALNPCYTIPQYNLGRTTLHEIGHYMGLFHIWGDDGAACTGDDFRQLGGTVQFPSGLFNPTGQGNTANDIGDTPNQAGNTTTCPTGTVTDACSNTAPGKMYQNYMDYTSDACYSMFTNQQVARMEWILDNSRAGLKTSLGCTPPANAVLLDVEANSAVSPGGSEFIGCNLVTYPGSSSCGGSVTPKVRIQNNGVTTLNTATVTYTLNGGTPVTVNATGLNLLTGYSTVVSFPAINLTASGTYTFVFSVSSPNGGLDEVSTNNSTNAVYTVSSPVASPVVEGFENATFPPANWTLTQESGTGNWARVTTTSATGTASAKFDNFNFTANTTSSLTSPSVTFSPTFNTASVSFNYAHQSYTAAPNNEPDELEVLISTNCGQTWLSLWKRTGSALITAVPANAAAAFSGNPRSQWTANPIRIDLTSYLAQTVQIRFVAKSGFGNNLYLDDINISGTSLPPNDARVSAINRPENSFCGTSFIPQVVVTNVGTANLTSVTVVSGFGAGTSNPTTNVSQTFTGLNVPSGGTTTLTLNQVTGLTNGSFTFRAYTDNPNGVPDQNTSNDTLRKAFVANVGTNAFPVVQTFETTWGGTATAPIVNGGWTVLNPNSNGTWQRSTVAARSGVASGMFDNFSLNGRGQFDFLVSPSLNFGNRDSAYITFDYAYKLYAAGDADSLDVVVSTNCGSTWTSIWSRGGADLATAPGTGGAAFTPTAAQWANVNINLEAFKNSGDVYVALRNRNNFGQRLFVDNINIVSKNIPNNDAFLTNNDAPGAVACETSPAVTITFRNVGKLPIANISAGYSVDGGANTTQSFTLTPAVAPGTARTITFTTRPTLALGTRNIKVFTFSPNNVQDENVTNDTLTKTFTVIQTTPAPYSEGFNGSTFPPTNWLLTEVPVNSTKWIRANKALNTRANAADSGMAFMQNFNTTTPVVANSLDYLRTPFLSVVKSDSVFLKFDVSAAARQYPGSTSISLDSLEVQASIDCGTNWISVYKKWGDNLQTINDPNNTYTFAFVPNDVRQWRTDSINLTALIANGGHIVFRFLNTSNNGNNVYLDNVNLYTKNLSNTLKTAGVTVAPNPVQNTVIVQHLLPPTNLRGIGFYNAAGQRLMYHTYNGNADSYLPFNISRFAAGVYTIKIEYTNKTVAHRIIKL